jgi:hypothetical protein
MIKRSVTECPEARSEGLLTEAVGDELVIFDSETNEAHALKPLAAAVFAACDGNTPAVELAAVAGAQLGQPVDSAQVDEALTQLEDSGLLVDSAPDGISRRRMLQVGGAAAAGVLVSSALVPALAAASTTCYAGAASQVGLLVENDSTGAYSFLTFGISGGGTGTYSNPGCDVGLNGTNCSALRPPSNWSATNHWFVDGHQIAYPTACPSTASITINPSSIDYSVPVGYKVVALYGHALGTTGQNCSGPFTSGAGYCSGTFHSC